MCSHDPELGDIQDIMTVRELPTNESLRTSVNLLPLKGIWPWSLSRARMHSFKASKLLLISAPSILHCLKSLIEQAGNDTIYGGRKCNQLAQSFS